jgi:hypothetical protein
VIFNLVQKYLASLIYPVSLALWDKTQYIAVWLDGEVPPELRKPSPITLTDADILTPQQITGLEDNRDKATFDLSSLLPFRVLVVDGINRTL